MSNPGENNIRNSIDRIEPADGAKERMLKNIRQKAAMQQPAEQPAQPKKNPKVVSFHRIARWAAPVAACFVLLIAGSFFLNDTPPVSDPSDVQALPPFAAVDSPQEITDLLGIEIHTPADAENVQCSLLDGQIAQIDFSWNGQEYTIRASAQDGDFSGVHGEESEPELLDAETNAQYTVIPGEEISYGKIFWTDGKIRFYLTGSGERPEEIKDVYQLIK